MLWDPAASLYRDNTTTAGAAIRPQDGNAHAINFNVTDSAERARAVAAALAARHADAPFGPPAPELPGAVSPFVTSQEVRAQFAARPEDVGPAVDLVRRTWGYMLEKFSATTCMEGYSADGGLRYPFYGDAEGFVSHAHAWSTGPVYSLLADLMGLKAAVGVDVPDGDGD